MKLTKLCVGLAAAHPAFASAFIVHTAVLPPFSNGEEREESGITIDLITELAKRTEPTLKVEYVPWPRAIKMTEAEANTFIGPPVRTPSREAQFHWVPDLIPSDQVFLSLGNPINNFDEARTLEKIAVLRGSVMERLLKGQGFTDLHSVLSSVQAAKLVKSGRADTWFAIDLETFGVFAEAGIMPGELIAGESVINAHHRLASNS